MKPIAKNDGTTQTLLFHSGHFADRCKVPLHSMFSIKFPWGLGGLDIKRQINISDE